MNKIFIIGPAWVGDMVMAQVLFKRLKEKEPSCQIDVLAPEWSKALLDRMPEVTNAYGLGIERGELQFKKRFRLAKTLAINGYNEAYVLPNSWKSALIPWLMRIPKRIGYIGECRFGLLNDARRLNKKQLPLMIDRFIALGYEKSEWENECQGNLLERNQKIKKFYPHLLTDPNHLQKTLDKFSLNPDKNNRSLLAICPGAEFGPSKRWPEEYYAEVAKQKIKEGFGVWIFGSQKDTIIAAKIMHLIRSHANSSSALQNNLSDDCIDFTGKTNLAEAIDLLSIVDWVLTNDSGLMHIAAALQKQLLVVYGSTDSKFTPPLLDTSKIVQSTLSCSPCFKRTCPLNHHHCMRELTPSTVLNIMNKDSLAVEIL